VRSKGKILHIGVIVKNMKEAIDFFERMFRISPERREVLEDRGIEITFLDFGNVSVELISPIKEGTAIDKFLEKRGGGLHHIAVMVENLTEDIKRFEKEGIKVVDGPRKGAEGYTVAFFDPTKTLKVLFELIEKKEDTC
jgi:methylmalonyl-CoA epimerase